MSRLSAGNEQNFGYCAQPLRRRTTSGNKFDKLFRNNSTYQSDEVSHLLAGLNQMVVTSKLNAKGANVQLRGVEAIAQWAKKSRNSAIDDVMQRTNQLFQMYTEKQMQFSRDLEHFVQQLRKIVDTERRVMEYEQDVRKKDEKLKRIKHKISKSSLFWKKSAADFARLREERDALDNDLELARRRLDAAREEAEVVKMFQFRQGMMGIADAYRNLATNCNLIFGCQREITEMVPAVSTQDVNRMLYDGSPFTRDRVEEVRRSLDNEEHPIIYNPPSSRQRTDGINHGNRSSVGTPPPPYTPTTHFSYAYPPSQNPCSRFSDSHLFAQFDEPTVPTSSRSATRVQPSAPEQTPLNRIPVQQNRIYPDLTGLYISP
ncbi:hypothetical protein M3Y97_00067000 [Aphelenchoides bicaudatus]|nr:hypothetical protein M3Y97_00067000 [Aphelenchoides bicaudatus]